MLIYPACNSEHQAGCILQSNNYISSMQFCIDSSLLLPHCLNNSLSLRRNIRIRSSKLPPDFFNHQAIYRYEASPRTPLDPLNRTIRTPSFENGKRDAAVRAGSEDHRKVETARPSLEKTQNSQDLITGILSTSKKLKRVFRKQSLEFKDSFSMELPEHLLRLPKILNRGLARRH